MLEECQLTTIGRRSGERRTIPIWFFADGHTLYMINDSGNAAWLRNIAANPRVVVTVDGRDFEGHASVVRSDAKTSMAARQGLDAKYMRWKPGRALSSWAKDGVLVAVVLTR